MNNGIRKSERPVNYLLWDLLDKWLQWLLWSFLTVTLSISGDMSSTTYMTPYFPSSICIHKHLNILTVSCPCLTKETSIGNWDFFSSPRAAYPLITLLCGESSLLPEPWPLVFSAATETRWEGELAPGQGLIIREPLLKAFLIPKTSWAKWR